MDTGNPSCRHVLTILAVDDAPRSAAFYRSVFGWEPQVELPMFVQLRISEGQGLGLYERGAFAANTGRPADRAAGGRTTGAELYFLCADVDAAVARLVEAGATELSPLARRPWGDEVAYFADPDANVVAVARSGEEG